ncbi:hypothetical protein FGB62_144g04 [Gracilaria domingensis]|nr:hypothetical protein FGB62_144g04 [Gracilaria domingensis]
MPEPSLVVVILLKGNNANDGRIEMKIRSDNNRARKYNWLFNGKYDDTFYCKVDLEFQWEEWIHIFEGCMKVLNLDFDDDDFCDQSSDKDREGDLGIDEERYTRTGDSENVVDSSSENESENVVVEDSNRNGSEEDSNCGLEFSGKVRHEENAERTSLSEEDVNRVSVSGVEKANESENQDNDATAMSESIECSDEIEKNGDNVGNEGELNEHSDASACDRADVDSNDVEVYREPDVGLSRKKGIAARLSSLSGWEEVQMCTCKYELNQSAEEREIGWKRKYYWHWEGWKPQPAFKKNPFLYELKQSDNRNGISVKEKEEDHEISSQVEEIGEAQQPVVNVSRQNEHRIVELAEDRDIHLDRMHHYVPLWL